MAMDCDREDLKERLVERLYGVEAKDGPSPDVLQRHLESCPDCREELEALRALRRDLSAWREPEPRALWRWGVAASWAGPGFWRLAAGRAALRRRRRRPRSRTHRPSA